MSRKDDQDYGARKHDSESKPNTNLNPEVDALKRKDSPVPQVNIPRQWSELSYAGEQRRPPAEEPTAGTWPTYYLKRSADGAFTDLQGNSIAWDIRNPASFDFAGQQLSAVKNTLHALTDDQIIIAEYWNAGPPTKQITPIADRLIDTYKVSASHAARILAALHAGINDAFVITWHFKYLWQVARPNQLDQSLATILCTPRHPSYPAGHGVVAGCAETILSYFFAPEANRLHQLAEECAISRIYGGVHYPVDCSEGLRLGRHVGRIVVAALAEQSDGDLCVIENPIADSLHANLPPPPYRQVIPFPRQRVCWATLDPREAPEAR